MNYSVTKFFAFSILILFFLVPTISSVNAQNATTTATTEGPIDSTITSKRYIQRWREQSSDLQQKINTLNSVASSSVYIPVLFGVEINNISPNFGDPRSGGRTHEGEDIMAVKGTPIVSPTVAVVLRTGVGTGEGNYVYTANPSGETFVYMHLDKLGEGITSGTVLEKGSLIGYVGNTGNASGGAAHLHFEILDNNGTPTDPFSRLTGTFTLQEKMVYLSKILTQTSDSNDLAQFLVLNFRPTFTLAANSGIPLPQIVSTFLTSTPYNTPPVASTLPIGDLGLGSRGSDVIRLQQYLITKNIGPNAHLLTLAGSTGNFGPITQSALAEYQTSVGISPSDGYYGPTTKVIVEANPSTTTSNTNATTTASTTINTSIFTHNLYTGINDEDVRVLQKFLNSQGYLVSSSDAGSLGNETTYFGSATKSAVIRFQNAHNILPAVGYVGPITRNLLASLIP